MKTIKLLTLGIICSTALSFSGHAATFFFDFGFTSVPTGGFYNDFNPGNASVTNIIDDTSTPSSITVMTSGWNSGGNQNGTAGPFGDAAIFDPAATFDSYFGHTNNFDQGVPKPLGLVVFTNLDNSGNTAYSFTMFAARLAVTDNRETMYFISGANSDTVYLDPANNESVVVSVTNIVPTAQGVITLEASRGPNNDNSAGFFYLGALRMISGPAPAIPNFTNHPVSQTVSPGADVTFTADVSNPAGVTYQWQLNNVNLADGGNIFGATTKTLTLTGVAATNVGHYRVQATNPQGTANSLEAALAIVGINFFPVVTIDGKLGDVYRVDYSTQVAPTTWIPLSTNTLTASPQYVIDPSSPGSNQRFYRAVYLP